MSSQVITFVADAAYLDHAKAFMVNCYRQGIWRGDFCAITLGDSAHIADLQSRGIYVFHIPQGQWNFMVKFWTFAPYFRNWDQALCCDLDVIVQADLHVMFSDLAKRLPKILCDWDDGDILRGLKYWDRDWELHPEVYTRLEERFPCVRQRMYNAAFIFFAPASMPADTRDQLAALHEEFKEANPTNADQMLMNLLLYDRLEIAGKNAICFFGHDYPGNRVASDSRGWVGNEVPTVLHYTRWHAPWVVKQEMNDEQKAGLVALGLEPEMGGYRCHRLGRICHELYAENLALFNSIFPVLV